MAKPEHQFTTPVGRMIGGSLYKAKTTNDKGEPLVYKTGAKKGQPRQEFNFGVAFPKSQNGHWASEPWLAPIWQLAHTAFPQGQATRADFSFKIIDGDSTAPNKKMKRPCDQEGYPGHWVVWFSSSIAPKAYNANGSALLHEEGAIKPGYYVQVMATVTDNQPSETPGLYWNPHYVALSGYGTEISGGPDVAAANFGQGVALPAGASATPLAGMATPPAPSAAPAATPMAPPPPPAAAPAPNAPPPPPPVGSALAAAPVAPTAPVPVHPNPAFTQMIPPPAAAPLPPPPAAAPVRQPTAMAQGRTREQLLAMEGWNEELLVQHGYLA